MIDDLYEILERDSDKLIVQISDENHPIFKAHFPGNPILPAFCQIDIILNILNDDLTIIKKSKFISHILPNDIISFLINTTDKKRKVEIFKENKKVSEIIYEKS